MSFLETAFNQLCASAVKREVFWVTLYCATPFYGGPEEGGWWGEDVHWVSSQKCSSEEEAIALWDEVKKYAEELSEASRKAFGDHCLKSMAWLEARGLEADYLPEVDGEETYFVSVEKVRGENEVIGDRCWS